MTTRLQGVTLAERLLGEIRGAVARGWCSPENQHKEMDATLALAIADEVARLWQSEAAAALSGEVDFLEDWLRFAAEPIGQECCGHGRQVGEFEMECCGNPEPVFNTAQDVIEAMAERHRELTAAPQPLPASPQQDTTP